ncbi:retrovirus-related pol polyprotein from transposon TNT 1-94 [Tanacetum coccineum]
MTPPPHSITDPPSSPLSSSPTSSTPLPHHHDHSIIIVTSTAAQPPPKRSHRNHHHQRHPSVTPSSSCHQSPPLPHHPHSHHHGVRLVLVAPQKGAFWFSKTIQGAFGFHNIRAEAINTACYTQNRSLIRRRNNKTPYEFMQDKKLDLSFFLVFGALCYPTNDNEDLGKLDAKTDIGLVPNPVSQQPCIPPPRDYWDHLFQPMFDEYFTPLSLSSSPVQEAAASRAVDLADSPVSTFHRQDAPSSSTPST